MNPTDIRPQAREAAKAARLACGEASNIHATDSPEYRAFEHRYEQAVRLISAIDAYEADFPFGSVKTSEDQQRESAAYRSVVDLAAEVLGAVESGDQPSDDGDDIDIVDALMAATAGGSRVTFDRDPDLPDRLAMTVVNDTAGHEVALGWLLGPLDGEDALADLLVGAASNRILSPRRSTNAPDVEPEHQHGTITVTYALDGALTLWRMVHDPTVEEKMRRFWEDGARSWEGVAKTLVEQSDGDFDAVKAAHYTAKGYSPEGFPRPMGAR